MGSLTGQSSPKSLATNSKRKPGRPRRVRVTSLERNILRLIAREGFQTLDELRIALLATYSRVHSWRVMKHLVRKGLLVESIGDLGGILGWSLSQEARRRLTIKSGEEWQANTEFPQYRASSFSHDLIVREVKAILCKSPIVFNWRPEHAIRKEVFSKIQVYRDDEKRTGLLKIPDASFNFVSSGKTFRGAIEVEIARKTRRRVYDRIEAHVINPDLDFFFFVVSDERHLQFLWSVYQSVLENSYKVKLAVSRNGIFFITLDELRKYQINAKFRGHRETFSFAYFRKDVPSN